MAGRPIQLRELEEKLRDQAVDFQDRARRSANNGQAGNAREWLEAAEVALRSAKLTAELAGLKVR